MACYAFAAPIAGTITTGALVTGTVTYTMLAPQTQGAIYEWKGTDANFHTTSNWQDAAGNTFSAWGSTWCTTQGTSSYNVMYFANSGYYATPTVTFDTFDFSGIVVDANATGYSVLPSGTRNRRIYFQATQDADATANSALVAGESNFIIATDFNLGSASGIFTSINYTTTANVTLSNEAIYSNHAYTYSTSGQTINVTGNGTYALNVYTSMSTDGNWNVTGGATLDLQTTVAANLLTTTGTGSVNLNNGTVALATASTIAGTIGVGADGGTIALTGVEDGALGTITLNGTITYTDSTITALDLSGSTISIGDDFTFSFTQIHDTEKSYDLLTNIVYDGDISDIDFNVTTDISQTATIQLSEDGNTLQVVFAESGAKTVIWGGSDGTWSTDDAWTSGESTASFADGDSVTFNTDTSSYTVSLDGDVTAASMSIEGENGWGLNSTEVGTAHTLDVGSITVDVTGTDSVWTGADVNITNVDTIQVTDGTFYIEGGLSNVGSIQVGADGNLGLYGTVDNIASITVADGGSFTLEDGATATKMGTLTLEGAATATFNASADFTSMSIGNGSTIKLYDGAALVAGDVYAESVTEMYTSGFNVTVNGGSSLSLANTKIRLNTSGAALTISGSDGGTFAIDSLMLSDGGNNATTVTIEEGATLHITGTNASTDLLTSSIVLGHWPVTNTVNVNGTMIAEAALTQKDGNANVIIGTNGTLELKSGLDFYDSTSGGYVSTITVNGTLKLGTNTQTSDSVDMSVTMNTGGTIESTANTTVYDAVTYSDDAAVNFKAEADTTLTMATAVTGSNVSATIQGGGTVSFASGASLNALTVESGASLTLAGTTTADSITNAGTLNINGELTSLLMRNGGANGDATLNIGSTTDSDTVMHITGVSTSSNYAGLITNGGGTYDSLINVYGSLILDSGIKNNASADAVFTVYDGGTLQLNRGTYMTSYSSLIDIQVTDGATLVLGNTIDDSGAVATTNDATITLQSGATLTGNGATFDGTDSFTTSTTTTSAFNFTLADNATVKLKSDAGNSLVLTGTLSSETAGVNIIGGGTVELAGETSLATVTVAADTNLSISGDYSFNSAIANSGTVSILDGALLDITGLTAVEGETGSFTITLVDGGTTTLADGLSYTNILTEDSLNLLTGMENISFDNGVLSYSVAAVVSDSYWNAATGTIMGGDGDYSDESITIDTSLAETALLNTGEAGTTVQNLDISGDKALTIQGEGALVAGAITLAADLTVDADVAISSITANTAATDISFTENASGSVDSLTLGASAIAGSSLDVAASIDFGAVSLFGTTATISGDASFDSLWLSGTGASTNTTSLTIKSGADVTVGYLRLSGGAAGNVALSVEAGAKLTVTGAEGYDYFQVCRWNGDNTIDVSGTLVSEVRLSSHNGSATFNVNDGGTLQLDMGLMGTHYNAESTDSTETTFYGSEPITININDGATLALGNQEAVTINGISLDANYDYATTVLSATTGNTYVASVEVNMASGSTITDNGAEATTTVYQSINYATDAEVTFATSGEGQTLVMDKAVNNNVTAKIDGEGTVEFAGGATLASVSIAEDATLTLSSAVSSTNGVSGGSMAITADGSLTVGNTTVAAVEGSTAGFYLGTTGSIADGALTNANIQHAAISADSLSINGEVSLSNSSTSASVSVATGNILYMSGTSVAGGITLSGGTLQVGDTSLSNNLKLTASSSLNTADGVALELNSIITMSEGATLNLSGVGDVSLGTDFSLVLDYSLSEGAYTIFTNSATDFSGDITNYSIEGGFSSDYSYEWGTNEAGDIILTVAAAGSEPSSGEIYYNATTGEYTDASGATVTPGTESEVAFNSSSDTTAGNIVDEDLSVKSITKTGKTTTTVTAGLTATGEIAIEQGTLALETDGSINSYTTVSEGASLSTKAMSITAADSADASITLGEDGYVDSYGYAKAATVSNAQVTVNGTTSFIYGSTIEADSKVDIQSGTLSIDDSSSLKASETKIASGAQIMLDSGYIVGQGEGGTLNIEDGGSLTTSGMSKAKVDSMLISINNDYTFEMNDSSLTATTVQLSNNAMMTLNGVTLGADTIFTSSTSYSLTSTRMMVGTQGMISMTGVNVLEASTLGGSLNINDTDYSISTFGSGLSVSLDGTLTVNLVLSDTEWSTFLTQLGTENKLSFTLNNFTGMDDSSIINLVINSESGDSLGYSASGLTSADFATDNLVISAATSAIIPEPSTATLSLLALAGLLARRRRKA